METTNALCDVVYRTLSIAGNPDRAWRDAVDEAASRCGGHATWRTNPSAGRAYALLELPDSASEVEIPSAPNATLYATAAIALAVFPAVAEALPFLREALDGPGRPRGVLAWRPCEGGATLEWDPAISSVSMVLSVVDVELARFRSGRRAELLSPLPPAVIAAIASDGLSAPDVSPERVLEMLVGNV